MKPQNKKELIFLTRAALEAATLLLIITAIGWLISHL
jgi:hypothetical protein